MSAEKSKLKRLIIILLSIVIIVAAIGVTVYFTLRESKEQFVPKIVFAQDDITATVGETKMIHAAVQLADGTIVEDGLVFSSSDTAVLQFGDESRGVFRVLDLTVFPEKVDITVSAPEYSVQSTVSVSIVRYSNKLSLDYNGATTIGGASVNVYYLHRINDLPVPEKTNYTFVGWFTDADEQYKNGDMFLLRDDVKLTAKFRTLLKLDGENGSVIDVDGVEYNQPLPKLEQPQKNGWTFGGWYTKRGGAGKKYDNGDMYIENEAILYAKWSREIELVSELDGGNDTVTVVYAAPISQIDDLDYSEYAGALFVGWYTERNGDGLALASDELYLFDDVTVLYACAASEVTFDDNDADSFVVPEHFYIPLGGTYGRLSSLPVPTKENWEFDGWFTEKFGDGDKITDDTEYSELKSGIVLHASWSSVFSFATELGKAPSMRVVYGKPFSPPVMTAQYDWSFDGWYSERYCNGEKQLSVESYTGAGSRTLYAGWKKDLKIIGPTTEDTLSGVVYGQSLAAQNKELPAVGPRDGLVPLWSISQQRAVADLVTNTKPLPKEASVLRLLWGLPGEGTASDPYTISSAAALNLFADSVNATEKIYNATGVVTKVTANITMSGTWSTPIANNNWEEYFSKTTAAVNRRYVGTFDGGSKTIYNLAVNVPSTANRVDTYVGLFGYIGKGGIVRNVILSGVKIDGVSVRDDRNTTKGGANNGGIAGLNSGTVVNCTVSGTVNGTAALDTQIGGIVGYMFEVGAKVENCVNNAAIGGTAGRCTSHGGILGSVNNGHIKNCTNNGTITGVNENKYHYNSSEGNKGYQFYGGISGVCCAVIEGCTNKGSVQKGYVASFGESGGAEIVGYLHDGSDSDISSNSNQSLYIDKTSGISYSNTYYYSGVINCTTANSGKNLLGFVQNDHGRIAVTSGYNSSTNAYAGSRAASLAGTYSIMYMSVEGDATSARALICSLTEITEPYGVASATGLPVWGVVLIVIGAAVLISAVAVTVTMLVRKNKKNKTDERNI